MVIKASEFSRLCKVSRSSITQAIGRNEIEKTEDGKIDTENLKNSSYLLRHNPSAIFDVGMQSDAPRTTPPKREQKKAASPPTTDSIIAAINDKQAQYDDDRHVEYGAGDGAAGYLTKTEEQEVMRKSLYDALKSKAEAQMKATQLDILHGTLGEREVFESFIMELWQSIQRNMLDVVPKQATLVCKRLGIVGHELEVIDVLEEDNKKRMDSVAHEVKSILEGRMVRKVTEVEE